MSKKPRSNRYAEAGRMVPSPDAKPTGLPAAPCFKCEARGWCEHRTPGSL